MHLRSLLRLAFGALCLGAFLGTASAGLVPIDLDVSSLFNSDVILNNGGPDATGYTAQGIFGDSTQGEVDKAGRIWMTQSVALAHNTSSVGLGDRDGLPDDGFFPATAFHPDIRLAYRNSDDGPNAYTSTSSSASFSFHVAPNRYHQLSILATTGSGSATLDATLHYLDGSSEARAGLQVPDWFWSITEDADRFYLIDGLDRLNRSNGNYENSNNPAIFGLNLHPDPTRTLVSVDIQKVGGGSSRLNVYGATGMVPEPASLTLLGLGALGLLARRRRT
ncbi:MAG: PEP-CTERM sorting domain-containing protein [Candidatus Brocadiia bacterium]